MSSEREHYLKLKRYVDSAAALAAQVQKDIEAGKKISTQTVLKLSKYVSASNDYAKYLDLLNSINMDLN